MLCSTNLTTMCWHACRHVSEPGRHLPCVLSGLIPTWILPNMHLYSTRSMLGAQVLHIWSGRTRPWCMLTLYFHARSGILRRPSGERHTGDMSFPRIWFIGSACRLRLCQTLSMTTMESSADPLHCWKMARPSSSTQALSSSTLDHAW